MYIPYHIVSCDSNAALNDLFRKIMERDIPPRYLLRLGHGAEDIENTVGYIFVV